MHEFSVCMALLEQVEGIAREHQAVRVEKILVKLGPLSGIEAPLLHHAYPLAAAGTVAEQAELLIKMAPVVVECTRCGAESEVPVNRLVCGQCGDYHTRLISGEEMLPAQRELVEREQADSTCA